MRWWMFGQLMAVVCLWCATAQAMPVADFDPKFTVSFEQHGRDKRLDAWLDAARSDMYAIARSDDPAVVNWWRQISALSTSDTKIMVDNINRITNASVTYKADAGGDVWGMPIDTLRHGGDCEDIALLKATALILKGWPREKIALVLGYHMDGDAQVDHAVLALSAPHTPWLLMDNLNRNVLVTDVLTGTRDPRRGKTLATAAGDRP